MTSWAAPESAKRRPSLSASMRVWERDDRRLREKELHAIEEETRALRERAGSLYSDFLDEPPPREPEALDRLARLSAACSFLSDAVTCLAAAKKATR